MSLLFYSEEEENQKEESIDNYKDLFEEYKNKSISLSEALNQMFISSNVEKNQINILIDDIIKKSEKTIEKNSDKIKEKYPNITNEDAIIISSYTCESKDRNFSPYKLLNSNLVSENRKDGINNISKYLFILLKSLRKLSRYYPDKENKYLYRCIKVKVNYMIDPFDKKSIPYIEGNKKTFWGFTSTSKYIRTTYNFLKEEEKNIKSGTIFTLYGDIWGYDITLFNFFHEEEVLLEPEKKFIVDQVFPPLNEVIHIRCNIQKSPLVLNFDNIKDDINNSKYDIIQKLRQNIYYSVFKVVNNDDKKNYIMKKIFLINFNDKERKLIENEIKILMEINSSYNIKYYEIFEDNDSINIIMEHLGKYNLKALIEKNKKKNKIISEDEI